MKNSKLFSAIFGLLVSSSVSATYIVNADAFGITDSFYPGTTASIEISPTLPPEGEGFEVTISGTWMAKYLPNREDFFVHTLPSRNLIYFSIDSNEANGFEGDIEELAPYTFSFSIGPEFVEEMNLKEPIYVALYLRQYPYGTQRWGRYFDLKWGLHEIPPRLGSGYWVSEDRPYQGLMIQQQGDVVIFYEMTYNRDSGQPEWIYSEARFQGNSANGKAYLPVWTNPRHYYKSQPTQEEISLNEGSGSIRVYGYNRVTALMEANSDGDWRVDASITKNATYKRWHFGESTHELPPTVPDFSGKWNFYEFDLRTLLSNDAIEFQNGSIVGSNTYQFLSTDQAWQLDCVVPPSGDGTCELKGDMVTFSFDFDSFNGNVATGLITDLSNGAVNPDGVLLRDGYTLPILAE